jgi:hypothetical protein
MAVDHTTTFGNQNRADRAKKVRPHTKVAACHEEL